jgi:hypothetical protein
MLAAPFAPQPRQQQLRVRCSDLIMLGTTFTLLTSLADNCNTRHTGTRNSGLSFLLGGVGIVLCRRLENDPTGEIIHQ